MPPIFGDAATISRILKRLLEFYMKIYAINSAMALKIHSTVGLRAEYKICLQPDTRPQELMVCNNYIESTVHRREKG
jgi:hypothetical protein